MNDTIRPVTKISELHNLPFVPSARLPHPCLLAKWEGLYELDLKASRFVLTEAGRAAS